MSSLVESRYNVWAHRPEHSWVFNALSGELHRLSAPERAALTALLDGGPLPAGHDDTLTRLVRGRVLTSARVDELEVLQRRYERGRSDRQHLGLTVLTTLGCNFDCVYCYEAKRPSRLRPDVADAVLRLVDSRLEALRALSVTWMGGEPLLAAQQVLDLSSAIQLRCERSGRTYLGDIVTNGWFLDGRMAAALAEAGVRSAQVTLDGPPAVHDRRRPHRGSGATFARILRNLTQAVDLIDIAVHVNLDLSNTSGVEDLLSRLADAGLAGRVEVDPGRVVNAENPGSPSASHQGTYERGEFAWVELWFADLLVRHGFRTAGTALPVPSTVTCTAARDADLVIGPDGELWKCWEDVTKPGASQGNLLDADLSAAHPATVVHDPFADDRCRACIALPVCLGGCVAHLGTGRDGDGQCNSFRYIPQHLIERVADELDGSPTPPLPSAPLACAPGVEGHRTAVAVQLVRREERT